MNSDSKPELHRIHYLDNLRALAMLLGIYLHAALAYADPSQSIWLATDTGASTAVDASIWLIHLFRMSLFFLLSGYFSSLVLARRGTKSFLVSRLVRIALPFVLFYPFLLAAMTIVIVFALSYLTEPKGVMGLIAAAAKNPNAQNNANTLTTMHLWFLYYLMFFSLIGICLSRIQRFSIDGLLNRPWLMMMAPLLLVPGIVGAGVPLPAPESFLPTWWPFTFYGLFYFAGWQLYGREEQLDRLSSQIWPILVISLIGCAGYYASMPTLDIAILITPGTSRPLSEQLSSWILTAYLSVSLTITSLLLGKRWLAQRNPLLSFISDSSYWMYLTHLPLVIFLQTFLIPFNWPLWLKLLFTIVGTVLPCLATYVVFVRYTPIGWMLHGKRKFP
ncbi:MAG: acyltransferase family protein [Planctomyces sp.]|nr:acyltransferase family protein [Planctomyces sp.]